MQYALRVVLLWFVLAASAGAQELFPRPPEIDDAVRFWTRVYTEVDSNGGFLHDSVNLAVVYEALEFDEGDSSRQRSRARDRAAEKYERILQKLGSGDRGGLNTDEARVLAMWPAGTSDETFRRAAGQVRFQLGQSDRFLAGLQRSGRWRPYIHSVLDAAGLPRELDVMPHVESSFDPTAYSKVGAAGMWQFTRSTGLRYMQIDHIVDERRDPFLSTDAAARLLKDNFDVIASWPLAITAYNHGLAGMRRAVRDVGTDDIGRIITSYRSSSFGFASRNFYPAFLAALDVDRNPEAYFGEVAIDPEIATAVVILPDYVDAAPLADAFGIGLATLQQYNPALMDTVWQGDKYVPRGFPLRVPAGAGADPERLLSGIPAGQRFAAQRPDLYHRVQPGDTLSQIAQRYRVSLAALERANGLSNRNFIRVGQQLTLPVTGQAASAVAAVLETPAEAPALAISEPAAATLAAGATLAAAPANTAPANTGPADAAPADAALAAIQPTSSQATPELVAAVAREIETDDTEPTAVEPESGVLASTQVTLAADPSDYSVAADSSIVVQDMETLGHYADWLGIRTQRLRDINGLPFGRAVIVGQRIRLDFSEVDALAFEARRTAYQAERQEAFFSSYQIEEIVNHVVSPGESLWLLAQRQYDVPVWLLRQYNPDLDLDRVMPGTVVRFPRLRSVAENVG